MGHVISVKRTTVASMDMMQRASIAVLSRYFERSIGVVPPGYLHMCCHADVPILETTVNT